MWRMRTVAMLRRRRVATVAATLAVLGGAALAAQDRFTLQVPSGLAFADIKGYETWQDVAVSQT